MLNKGEVVEPDAHGKCGRCGCGGFVYSNGFETSKDGIRGYRCLGCGSIKPEREIIIVKS